MTDTPEQKLAAFGAWCLAEHREGFGDLDGGELQEKAKALGLIVPVTVAERCGDDCACADYADFPQECLRLAEGVGELVRESRR